MPLDDLESKLDTDLTKVRQIHQSLFLLRVPKFKIILKDDPKLHFVVYKKKQSTQK